MSVHFCRKLVADEATRVQVNAQFGAWIYEDGFGPGNEGQPFVKKQNLE